MVLFNAGQSELYVGRGSPVVVVVLLGAGLVGDEVGVGAEGVAEL